MVRPARAQYLGERDLAMANWIRLSLHDPVTGQPDAAKQAELFGQLRAGGLDTQQIELHAAQGFRSSADVQACANQIRAFSQARATPNEAPCVSRPMNWAIMQRSARSGCASGSHCNIPTRR